MIAPTALAKPPVVQLNSLLSGGGTDDQCCKLAAGLRRRGWPVCVAGPEGRDFSKVLRTLDVPLADLGSSGPLKWRTIFRTARILRAQKARVLHGHHGRDYWPAVLAARLSGVRPKLVLTRHLAKSPGSPASRRYLLACCDLLVAVSEATAKILRDGSFEPDAIEEERRRRLPMRGDHSKIKVVHGGIDTDQFRPFDASALRAGWGLEPNHFAFAVVGGYGPPRGKGQREFLRAAAAAHKEIPDARFLIIGRGGLKGVLEDDIVRLGLEGKAWLTPYCHDMPSAMNAIDCLVHPAIGTESFGLVVCEAFSCGKPALAASLDGIPEAFAMGGFGQLFKPESVGEMGGLMRTWAVRPRPGMPERERLWRQIAEKCGLDRMAGEIERLYLGLL